MQNFMKHWMQQYCIKCCTRLPPMLHDVAWLCNKLQHRCKKIVYVVLLHSFAIPTQHSAQHFAFSSTKSNAKLLNRTWKQPKHNVLSCWCPCSKKNFFVHTTNVVYNVAWKFKTHVKRVQHFFKCCIKCCIKYCARLTSALRVTGP